MIALCLSGQIQIGRQDVYIYIYIHTHHPFVLSPHLHPLIKLRTPLTARKCETYIYVYIYIRSAGGSLLGTYIGGAGLSTGSSRFLL